jgi:hypothetical protein
VSVQMCRTYLTFMKITFRGRDWRDIRHKLENEECIQSSKEISSWKTLLVGPWRRGEDNIKMHRTELHHEDVSCCENAEEYARWLYFVNKVTKLKIL